MVFRNQEKFDNPKCRGVFGNQRDSKILEQQALPTTLNLNQWIFSMMNLHQEQKFKSMMIYFSSKIM